TTTSRRRRLLGALLLLLRADALPFALVDERLEALLQLLGWLRLRQVAVDRDHVAQRLLPVCRPTPVAGRGAQRLVLVPLARAVAAERHRRLAQADLALRLDESLRDRDPDPGRAAARV